MNPDHEKLRALLDEVLPFAAEQCGPSNSEVLGMLRRERRRIRCTQISATALAGIALVFGVLIWKKGPVTVAPIAQAPARPAPLVIQHVDDEQLLTLLKGTPAALVKMPNGSSTLLVIEN